MSDVSNCVTSLKKVANELKSLGASEDRLQMAQTSIRYVPQVTWELRQFKLETVLLLSLSRPIQMPHY
jgi:hypothetical protein